LILNLGSGKKKYIEAVNVDIKAGRGDMVVDLSKFPWPWEDNSVDGIHASHIMEHIKDQRAFVDECKRILKPGGFLRIVGPHASCVTSVGCLEHYRTYSYNAFKDYIKGFKTVEQDLRWWYEEIDAEGNVPEWMHGPIKIMDICIRFIIAIVTPRVFENLFCPAIQCREVIWKGIKK